MEIKAGELVTLLVFDNESCGLVVCQRDCDMNQLKAEYTGGGHKYNVNNVTGFVTWIIERGYFLPIKTRVLWLGNDYVDVQEVE